MNILATIEKKAKKSLNKKIIVDKQVLIDKLDEKIAEVFKKTILGLFLHS